MNARSIRFRLTIWYAGLLTLLLAMFGGVIYFTLERFLERNLSDTLAKDAVERTEKPEFVIGQPLDPTDSLHVIQHVF